MARPAVTNPPGELMYILICTEITKCCSVLILGLTLTNCEIIILNDDWVDVHACMHACGW